jgi:DNA-binding protein HU-beta
MNKSEFAALIAELNKITIAQANILISTFTDSVTAALMEGHQIQLVGFGSFESKQIPARTGRNPQTGAPMQIKASIRPTFKAGKALKDAVN